MWYYDKLNWVLCNVIAKEPNHYLVGGVGYVTWVFLLEHPDGRLFDATHDQVRTKKPAD